jgi:hypothetical protein
MNKFNIPLYINEFRYIRDYSFIEHYRLNVSKTNYKYRTINQSNFGIFIKIYE